MLCTGQIVPHVAACVPWLAEKVRHKHTVAYKTGSATRVLYPIPEREWQVIYTFRPRSCTRRNPRCDLLHIRRRHSRESLWLVRTACFPTNLVPPVPCFIEVRRRLVDSFVWSFFAPRCFKQIELLSLAYMPDESKEGFYMCGANILLSAATTNQQEVSFNTRHFLH